MKCNTTSLLQFRISDFFKGYEKLPLGYPQYHKGDFNNLIEENKDRVINIPFSEIKPLVVSDITPGKPEVDIANEKLLIDEDRLFLLLYCLIVKRSLGRKLFKYELGTNWDTQPLMCNRNGNANCYFFLIRRGNEIVRVEVFYASRGWVCDIGPGSRHASRIGRYTDSYMKILS